MARAHLRFVVQDREGNAIQNAAVYAYQPGTTTAPYGTMYTAETAGSSTTNPLLSNSTGVIEAWLDTAQLVDLKVTDNTDAAYVAESGTLSSWTEFTVEDVSISGGAASDIALSATGPVGFVVESNSVDVSPFAVQLNNGDGNGTVRIFDVENNNPGPADINIRNSNVTVGSIDSAEQLYGIGPMQFRAVSGATGNFIQAYNPGSTTTIVFRVNNAGTTVIASGGLATNALQVKTYADTQPVLNVLSTGGIEWGVGGSTAVDVSLSRSAANVLALGSNDALKTGAAVHGSLPAATGYAAGSQFYCTTDKQPLWSDGSVWVEADGTNH